MRYLNVLILTITLSLLVACAPQGPTGDVTVEPPQAAPTEPTAPEEPQAIEPTTPAPFTVDAVEGDLISLSPEAIDPDGDRIIYTFGKPFDADGRWQTAIGDEGEYEVAVGATDGKSTTTETILVVVNRANRPPVIDCKEPIAVKEGERVDLHDACSISDEDDTDVVVTYEGWMQSWRKDVGYDEAGSHIVRITASDKRQDETLHIVTREVQVNVEDVNRAPEFPKDFPETLAATENDVIALPVRGIVDPDGDAVTVTFSEPFTDDGVWRTRIGDAGTYTADVVASDGVDTTKRTVAIKLGLRNTPPTLREIADITVEEGETVDLPISATDREGDKLTTVITGWMDGATRQTGYEDAGDYTVTVAVTDGVFTTTQIVQVTVVDKNRPPVFVSPA